MRDVIVIGGGPVGSYTAGELARMGHTVMVLEQREGLEGRVCCTGIVSLECIRSFAIEDGLILRQINSARLFSPSGRMLYIKQRRPAACILDRTAFDLFLVRRAREEGAEYLPGTEVRMIEVGDDRVKVRVNQSGEVDNFEAKAVVLATGAGSRLTTQMAPVKDDFVLGAQAEVESKGIDEIEVYWGNQVAPGFFAWLVPTLPGKALVGLLSRKSAGSYLRRLLSSLEARGKIVSDRVELVYRGITLKSEARSYGNRRLIVGGAAAQVKPTTGGGIYYGLLGARIAAETLHKALEEDNLSSDNLAVYEREWKSRLGQEIITGHYARGFYEHLTDRQIDDMFKLAASCGLGEGLLAADLSFDWHSRTILKLLGQGIISRAINTMASSFPVEIFSNEY